MGHGRRAAGAALVAVLLGAGAERAYGQKVVTYPTEDGQTLHATLHLPPPGNAPFGGIVLFAEPGWIVRATFDTANLGRQLAAKHGMAALTVDFRGTGSNVNGRLLETFSSEDFEKLQLDVRGALKFLASQNGVDADRLGIVSVGRGAHYALLEAAQNPAVQAHVIISGDLGDRAKQYIASRSDIPILCLASKNDKRGFREMAEASTLSDNEHSDFLLGRAGHGTVMFNRTKGLGEQVTQWLADNVQGLGNQTDITFNTQDGWKLHGKLQVPHGASAAAPVAGVLLVHGAMHDQDTYYELTRALVKKGLATLTYDWRGKNRDPAEGKGYYGVDLTREDQDKTYLDVKAALDFFAAQKGVDPNRIGIVAATMGTVHALHGAAGDARVRTMAMLSQYVLDDRAKTFLTSTDIPIFFIVSSEDLNYEAGSLADFTREAYRLSKNKHTELLMYEDAGRGSEMLKVKSELEPMIVRWMVEKLAK
jgi:dienelactone hydrolase